MNDEQREWVAEWLKIRGAPLEGDHDVKCWTYLAQKINRIEKQVHKPWWRKLLG